MNVDEKVGRNIRKYRMAYGTGVRSLQLYDASGDL